MDLRSIALGLGAGVTTFLLVGAATIVLLGGGESPGVGILGVAAGLMVGLLATVLAGGYADRLSGVAAAGLTAYAAFGSTFLAIAAASYVGVPGVDEVMTFPVRVAASLVVALALAAMVAGGRFGGRPAGA